MKKISSWAFLLCLLLFVTAFVGCGKESTEDFLSPAVIRGDGGPREFDGEHYQPVSDALLTQRSISESVYLDVYDKDETDDADLHTYYVYPIRLSEYFAKEYRDFQYRVYSARVDPENDRDIDESLYCDKTVEEWEQLAFDVVAMLGYTDSPGKVGVVTHALNIHATASQKREEYMLSLFSQATGMTLSDEMPNRYYAVELSDAMLLAWFEKETPKFFLCTEGEYLSFYFFAEDLLSE